MNENKVPASAKRPRLGQAAKVTKAPPLSQPLFPRKPAALAACSPGPPPQHRRRRTPIPRFWQVRRRSRTLRPFQRKSASSASTSTASPNSSSRHRRRALGLHKKVGHDKPQRIKQQLASFGWESGNQARRVITQLPALISPACPTSAGLLV